MRILPFMKSALLFSIFISSFATGMLWASEEAAGEKMMSILLEFKDKGFVNVRGERRGYLSNQGVLKQRIKLFKGQEYLAVVSGDDDMGDVNLIIKDKSGKTEIQRMVGKGQSSITFSPPKKDKYYFVIEAPNKGGYYQFSLVTK
jgi:hypothetical protein